MLVRASPIVTWNLSNVPSMCYRSTKLGLHRDYLLPHTLRHVLASAVALISVELCSLASLAYGQSNKKVELEHMQQQEPFSYSTVSRPRTLGGGGVILLT